VVSALRQRFQRPFIHGARRGELRRRADRRGSRL